MNDEELLSYAKKVIKENGIKTRKGLAKADPGLHAILYRRNLLDAIIPDKRKQRNWSSMNDKELISYAKTYILKNTIKTRSGLEKSDRCLYRILTKRNFLDILIPKKRKARDRRKWYPMSDEELVSYAKTLIEKNRIKNRKDFGKTDSGLYGVLLKRNILDAVIPEKYGRDWSSMNDKELISHAKKFVEKNEIKNRTGLKKADMGLYKVLWKRNLLGAVVPEKREKRDWSPMIDEKLVSYAKTLIEKNGIKKRTDLHKADQSFYQVLRKRNLLDVIVPDKKEARDPRNWASMSDVKLISYAKTYIEENNIKNRKALEKADGGLNRILRIRNLLDAVIPMKLKRRNWSLMTDEELISFAKKFITENEIKDRSSLRKVGGGLCTILRIRNLTDTLIPGREQRKRRKQRDWVSISDDNLTLLAKKFVEENGIKNKSSLDKADRGLYEILRKRKLLDAVFSDIEQAKKTEAVKQVVDAMKEF